MISCFVKEQRRYTKDDLAELLQISSDDITRVIKRMKEYGVLKTVKKSSKQLELTDLADEDVLIIDEDDDSVERYYVFAYVGVLMVENRVIKCCPKYFVGNEKDDKEIWEEQLRLVLRVLQKYQSKNQMVQLYLDGKENSYNELGARVYFINDYFDNGAYTNTQEIIEINGSGEPIWDRIINETYAIIQDGQPIYTELKTRRKVVDKDDYVRRLHQCLISECSRELEKSGLTKLLNIDCVELSDDVIDDFGDTDYILYKLECERSIQFNTRKQNLLTAMIAFFEQKGIWDNTEKLNLYGTSSFNLIWESVCASGFDSCLHYKINTLPFPKQPTDLPDALGEKELISVIEHPKWYGIREDNTEYVKEAGVTLKPDFAYYYHHDDNDEFVIFDAKYYCITLDEDKNLKGQPGVEDITKQYIYQAAYKQFMEDRGVISVNNAFILPSCVDKPRKIGYASLRFLEYWLKLNRIAIIAVNAEEMYTLYLSDNQVADMKTICSLIT